MISVFRQRWTCSMMCGLYLVVALAGVVQAQQLEEDPPKPELFTREYPEVKQFRLHNRRPVRINMADNAVKLPDWQPRTAGLSDGQLVDEIEQLRTLPGEPKFISSGSVALAGVPIVSADISADGSTLLTYDNQQRLTTWSMPEGKKLVEFALDSPSDSAAVAISPDSTKVLFGDASCKVLLLNAQTGKVEFTHDALDFPIADVAFSAGGTKIAAADIKGEAYIAPPSAVGQKQPQTNAPDYRPYVDIAVADSGGFGLVASSDVAATFAAKVGYSTTNNTRNPHPFAAVGANDQRVMLADHQRVSLIYKRTDNFKVLTANEYSTLAGFDVRFDSRDQTAWIATTAGIDIRSLQKINIYDMVRFPQIDAPIDHVLMAPDVNQLLMITSEGKVERWQLQNNLTQAHAELIEKIYAMVEEGRFEALELLAERWSGIEQNIVENECQSLYLFLVNQVREHQTAKWPEKTQLATFKKFVEANPNCEFFRVVLTMDAIEMAWDNRGRGYASGVDEDEYKYFRMNLEEATNMLMQLFQREEPPCPEAYVQAMELSKVNQWSEEETEYLLAEAMKYWPTYARIYGEAAVGKMPRWGGAQDASADLAKQVADAVGGDDGDILYAEIARWTRNYHSWDEVYEFLGFDKQRVLDGYAKSVLQNPIRQNVKFNQALIMAKELDDRRVARQLMELFVSSGVAPLCTMYRGGLPGFKETTTWALGEPYQITRIEPKLGSRAPEDFAPNAWELAKVDELDALAHNTDQATFVQENSFSVGKKRPWKMDVAGNGTTAATIDDDGNLTVWDVVSGKSVLELTGEDAPGKGAVQMSPDGKTMVVGTEKGAIELRDTQTGKLRFQLVDLEGPITDVGLSTDAKYLYGVDSKNGMHVILQGEKGHWPIEKLNPGKLPLVDPIAVGINYMGEYFHAKRHEDKVEVLVMAERNERVAIQKMTLPESVPTQIITARGRFIVAAGDTVIRSVITNAHEAKYEAQADRMLQPIRRCKFTADAQRYWSLSDAGIDIREWYGSVFEGMVHLPAEVESIEGIRLAPDGKTFLNFDSQGNATVWKLHGNPLSQEYRLVVELSQLISEGRYNTLELLADRWATDPMPGQGDLDESLYSSLIRRINLTAVRTGESEEHEERLRDYLAVRPQAKLIRLALSDLLFQLAQASREEISEEQYQQQLEASRNILSAAVWVKDAPPEAFAAAIRLRREQRVERAEIKKILTLAGDQQTSYPRIAVEACAALLPKYGGEPDTAHKYAQSLADQAVGKQGDVLYFQIASGLSELEGWTTVLKKLQFDQTRVLHGLVERARNYPRRELIRTGLQMAYAWKDREAGTAIAQIIAEQHFVPFDYEWTKEGRSYDEAITWAKGN